MVSEFYRNGEGEGGKEGRRSPAHSFESWVQFSLCVDHVKEGQGDEEEEEKLHLAEGLLRLGRRVGG